MKPIVYADNAATTRLSPRVLEAMLPFLQEEYGNASSLYSLGRKAREPLEDSRNTIARCLGAENREIFFTSGGSEANNWALKGAAAFLAQRGKYHIISTAFEHPSVLRTLEALKREGFSVTLLPVHENGIVQPQELERAIREDTGLVSIMYANNEVGTIQPIEELGAICREHDVWFHTDAVQAAGALPIDVVKEHIDLLSLSGHKFHGPKGIGALYIREGLRFPSLIDGGEQESGRRAGTENTAAIVGLGVAMEEACQHREENTRKVRAMRDRLLTGLLSIPGCHLNGDREHRLSGNLNLSFAGIEGESLLLMLDMRGICASSGSACASGSRDPSYVLRALGVEEELAKGSLRLTLGDLNTEEEVDVLLREIPATVERLRQLRGWRP